MRTRGVGMAAAPGLGAPVVVPALPASGRSVSGPNSSKPPANLFSLPAGATTQTLPEGTSIP
jgi:hypothetical protein